MNRRRILEALSVLLCALLGTGAAGEAPPPAQDMVAAADRVRNPQQPFRLTDTLVEYRNGQPRDRVELVIFAREDSLSHQYNNLVRYVDPPRDEGKMVLFHGTDMWFYDPASKDSVRISPQQRLLGQASDGDVMTANLSRDYAATLTGDETVLDAEHKDRHCWHLNLTASNSDAVYSRIEYWLEQGSYRPVKGKYYSDSGRLLKIAYFHRYQTVLGAERPTESIIIDAVDASLVTTMTTSDYRQQDIPDAWFQRDYLPHVKAD
jgi:hypothetical protein